MEDICIDVSKLPVHENIHLKFQLLVTKKAKLEKCRRRRTTLISRMTHCRFRHNRNNIARRRYLYKKLKPDDGFLLQLRHGFRVLVISDSLIVSCYVEDAPLSWNHCFSMSKDGGERLKVRRRRRGEER